MLIKNSPTLPEDFYPLTFENGWRTTRQAQADLAQIVKNPHVLECWRNLRRYPELKPYPFGRRVLYRIEDLKNFVACRLQQPA